MPPASCRSSAIWGSCRSTRCAMWCGRRTISCGRATATTANACSGRCCNSGCCSSISPMTPRLSRWRPIPSGSASSGGSARAPRTPPGTGPAWIRARSKRCATVSPPRGRFPPTPSTAPPKAARCGPASRTRRRWNRCGMPGCWPPPCGAISSNITTSASGCSRRCRRTRRMKPPPARHCANWRCSGCGWRALARSANSGRRCRKPR